MDQWDIPALILRFHGKSQITLGQVGTSPLDQWDNPTIPKHSSEMSYISPMAHPHHLYGGFLASIRCSNHSTKALCDLFHNHRCLTLLQWDHLTILPGLVPSTTSAPFRACSSLEKLPGIIMHQNVNKRTLGIFLIFSVSFPLTFSTSALQLTFSFVLS